MSEKCFNTKKTKKTSAVKSIVMKTGLKLIINFIDDYRLYLGKGGFCHEEEEVYGGDRKFRKVEMLEKFGILQVS